MIELKSFFASAFALAACVGTVQAGTATQEPLPIPMPGYQPATNTMACAGGTYGSTGAQSTFYRIKTSGLKTSDAIVDGIALFANPKNVGYAVTATAYLKFANMKNGKAPTTGTLIASASSNGDSFPFSHYAETAGPMGSTKVAFLVDFAGCQAQFAATYIGTLAVH